MPIIRDMRPIDIVAVAKIHKEAFPNDSISYKGSYQWIRSKYFAWPINRYFTAIHENDVIGYILWAEMGGFRRQCVLELEQLAVSKESRAKGVGTQLIDESLKSVAEILFHQNRSIKLVEITTGVTNEVQTLYEKTLGAAVECKKREFYDEDEVVMIARHYAIDSARRRRAVSLISNARSQV